MARAAQGILRTKGNTTMILRTRTFGAALQADAFKIPQEAHSFRIHPQANGSLIATWYERSEEEQRWGNHAVMRVRPSVLAMESVANPCPSCTTAEHTCAQGWARGRKCCPDCRHGVGCRLTATPYRLFRPKGIALLGVAAGSKIDYLKVGTMALGESSDPIPAELCEPRGGAVLDKLGELGITELGDVTGMTTDSVGKLIETLEAHTPFVSRAFDWPTALPGHTLWLQLTGYARGAVLWGLTATMAGDSGPA